MANPYGYGAPPPVPAGKDKTQQWGILALVFSILPCCPLVGIVFAILQIVEAKKWNKTPTMGYIALAFAALWIVVNIILAATGNTPGMSK